MSDSDATKPHDFVDKDGDGKCDVCGKAKGADVHSKVPAKPDSKGYDRKTELRAAAEQRATFMETIGIKAGDRITRATRMAWPAGAVSAAQQPFVDQFAGPLARASAMPSGFARLRDAKASLRASTTVHAGRESIHLNGIASVTDKPYEMYDWLGTYDEIMERNAFDETLSADPDVAFLLNHKGMTMARTKNRTLQLSMAPEGLQSDAYLNPERTDCRDLVTAIEDGDIDEMSFAFMIEEAWWSEDFETFRISQVNIDRGDVSAVNYGANPYTSIGARTSSVFVDLRKLPAPAARRAMQILSDRDDLRAVADVVKDIERRELVDQGQADLDAGTCATERRGRSIAQVKAMLDIE